MENRIYDILKDIKAEEQLKRDTLKKLYTTKEKKTVKSPYKMVLSTCVALGLVLFIGMFSYDYYFTESAYIDIDVNPSMELTINRFNKVIDVYAYNEDGANILRDLKLKYKSYDVAVADIMGMLQMDGYLNENGLVSATITTNWEEKSRLEKLEEIVSTFFPEPEDVSNHEVYAIDSVTKKHSHDVDITPAKYLAIQELQKVAPGTTVEGCKNHSISEIRKETYDHEEKKHKQEKAEQKHHQEDDSGYPQGDDGSGHKQGRDGWNHQQDEGETNHQQGSSQSNHSQKSSKGSSHGGGKKH